MSRRLPGWFVLGEEATSQVMQRVAQAASASQMLLQVRAAPQLAHWFMLDSLLLANRANRQGMHANALSLTRQCLEALSIIELGICGHKDAESILVKWDSDNITAGKLRAWLEVNVWPNYGQGLWHESWGTFMREFAAALQPYAHYGSKLAQWQVRLVASAPQECPESETLMRIVEMRPRAYDSQKATRITLFHAILTYLLGRIVVARDESDREFGLLIRRLGGALGRSPYLDGHATNWGQQFWAMLWDADGNAELE